MKNGKSAEEIYEKWTGTNMELQYIPTPKENVLAMMEEYKNQSATTREGGVRVTVEYSEHDKIVLTNERGDTYTSKSEELMDFFHGLPPPPPNQKGKAGKVNKKK